MNYVVITFAVFVCYMVVAINTIAISSHRYGMAAASSFLFCSFNYLVIRKIAEANSWGEFVAYAVGGVGGDIAGIWFSQWLSRRVSAK